MQKKYQIFVSSTYEDLVEERKGITQAILSCNCIPAGMEMWPASSRSQWEIIKGVIDESDLYLVVIGGRYGSEGTDERGNKKSYTEMEFDYAVQKAKRIVALIHRNPEDLPFKNVEKEPYGRKKLELFRKKAMNGRLVAFWDNPENLKSEVIRCVASFQAERPAGGWVREQYEEQSADYEDVMQDIADDNELNCVLIQPKQFMDAAGIADNILKNMAVILDLGDLDQKEARRILDFTAGVQYANGGSIQKIAERTYAFVPVAIEIDTMNQRKGAPFSF